MTEPRKTTEAARSLVVDAIEGLPAPDDALDAFETAIREQERQRYRDLVSAAREPLNTILEVTGKADIIGIDPAARRVFEGIMTLIEEKARAAPAAIEQEGRS